jgi:hypothetical protein
MVQRGNGFESITDTYTSGSIPVTERLAEILAAG